MGKMIVAARDLPEGHRITLQDIEYRSPFKGLPPSDTPKVIGKVLKLGISQFAPLSLEIFN